MQNKKLLLYILLPFLLLALLLVFPSVKKRMVKHYTKQAEAAEKDCLIVQAGSLYMKALSLDPKNPSLYIKLANVYDKEARLDDAIRLLARCAEVAPNNAEVFYRMGLIEIKRKERDKALEHFRKAIEIDPAYDPARLEAARLLYQQKKLDEVIALLQESTMVHPRDPDAFLLLCLCLHELHRDEEASAVMEKSLTLSKPPKHALTYLLADYEKKKDRKRIEKLLDRYKSEYADNFEILMTIAGYYLSKNHLLEAEKVYKTAAENIRDDVEPSLKLGHFYMKQRKYDEALKAVEPALKIDPNSSEVYCLLGLIQVERKDYVLAEEEFLRCLEIREKQPVALNSLAWLYLTVKKTSPLYKPKEAVKLARKAAALKPDDAAIVDTYARALYASGKYNESIIFYSQNENKRANLPYAYYGLALNYFKMNNAERGDVYLEKALKAGFCDRKLLAIDSDVEEIKNNVTIQNLLQEKQ